VGFAGLGPSHDEDAGEEAGEVYAIYVHPDHWGQGLGGALWVQAVEALRTAGYRTLTLWVLEANGRARGFYEHMGCTLDPGARKVIDRQGTQLPVVRYRLAL
jgi:ribosomal protein S18 acetylase RimI-like enzyme